VGFSCAQQNTQVVARNPAEIKILIDSTLIEIGEPLLQVVWKIPEKLRKEWAVLDSPGTLSRATWFT
jgi:hypothetical protein